MGFHEVSFPNDESYGSSGGPGFNTAIIELPGGSEQRVGRWAQGRRRFNVAYDIKTWAQCYAVQTFYIARQGALYGFRYKDWRDYATTADGRTPPWGGVVVSHQDQLNWATGDGVTTQFQLQKRYTSGPNTIVRKIDKPIAGTVLIAFSGVQQTTGWTVDTTTGIVTFTVAPPNGTLIRWGGEYEGPYRFEKSVDELFDITLDSFGSASVPDLWIIELIDEQPQTDLIFHGGATRFGVLNDDVTITALHGRVIQGEPQSVGLKIFLPDAKTYQTGGPHFLIVNEGTQAWSVRNSSDTQIVSVPVAGSAEIWLALDAGLAKVWWAK
jgi:uncharacterized protein (TIGR02217 family)